MPFDCEFDLHISLCEPFAYLREALTARFIVKGIPEPLCVGRVEIQTLTLFLLYNFTAKSGESIGYITKYASANPKSFSAGIRKYGR